MMETNHRFKGFPVNNMMSPRIPIHAVVPVDPHLCLIARTRHFNKGNYLFDLYSVDVVWRSLFNFSVTPKDYSHLEPSMKSIMLEENHRYKGFPVNDMVSPREPITGDIRNPHVHMYPRVSHFEKGNFFVLQFFLRCGVAWPPVNPAVQLRPVFCPRQKSVNGLITFTSRDTCIWHIYSYCRPLNLCEPYFTFHCLALWGLMGICINNVGA
jgi:hypothetical protein